VEDIRRDVRNQRHVVDERAVHVEGDDAARHLAGFDLGLLREKGRDIARPEAQRVHHRERRDRTRVAPRIVGAVGRIRRGDPARHRSVGATLA
jgi:hypothetical protein